MVANGTHHHNGGNGVHAAQLYAPCASDYEAIDVTPTVPKPAWRDEFPTFTHHLQWVDADGITHGLTLRSDDLQGLMSDLRMVKGMIRQAKQQASERAPQQATQAQADGASEEEQPDVQHCRIHKADMIRRWSKRTQGHYFAHKAPDGNFCYGRAPKA
jgi:hypothetical protein